MPSEDRWLDLQQQRWEDEELPDDDRDLDADAEFRRENDESLKMEDEGRPE